MAERDEDWEGFKQLVERWVDNELTKEEMASGYLDEKYERPGNWKSRVKELMEDEGVASLVQELSPNQIGVVMKPFVDGHENEKYQRKVEVVKGFDMDAESLGFHGPKKASNLLGGFRAEAEKNAAGRDYKFRIRVDPKGDIPQIKVEYLRTPPLEEFGGPKKKVKKKQVKRK
ncbi:MAG: hypothetical protein KAW41_04540 [Candidatus Diapherotrites archaeon]|nr:hypothetical protein [Candidatus Diapherotrites archaeon]